MRVPGTATVWMVHRSPAGRLATLVAVAFMLPGAAALAQNKCDAGKLKCVRGKAGCLVKVHEASQKNGLPADAAKLQKCMAKFDGGAEPAKGCFAKLEAAPGATCSTTGNTASIEALIDGDVQAVLDALAVAAPPSVPNKCDAGKLKCVRSKFACLVKVYETAHKKGLPPDQLKLSKCMSKFDGGAEPAKGCFARLEAQPDASCSTTGNTAAMEAQVDQDVENLLAALALTIPTTTLGPTTSTTVTPASTTTTLATGSCLQSAYPTCGGTCSGGHVCRPINYPNFPHAECACVPDAPCGCKTGANCPSGQICAWYLSPVNFACLGAATCGTTTTTTTLPCGGCAPGLTCMTFGGTDVCVANCGDPIYPLCTRACPAGSGTTCNAFPPTPEFPSGLCLCLS